MKMNKPLAVLFVLILVLQAFSFTAILPHIVNGTIIMSSGWEDSGGSDVTDAGAWSSSVSDWASITITDSESFEGIYALNVTTDQYSYKLANVYLSYDGNGKTSCLRVHFNLAQMYSGTAKYLFAAFGMHHIIDQQNIMSVQLYKNATDTYFGYTRYYPSEVTLYNSSINFAVNEWHYFDMKFVDDNTNGEYTLSYDGEQILSETGLDTSAAAMTYMKVGFKGSADSYESAFLDGTLFSDSELVSGITFTNPNLVNATRAENTTAFHSTFTSTGLPLSYCWVESNVTGATANSTAVAISGFSDSAIVNLTLPSLGNDVSYRWIANDTSGEEFVSDSYILTTTTATSSDLYTEGADIKLTASNEIIKLKGVNYNLMHGSEPYPICYWAGKGNGQYDSQWNLDKAKENIDAMQVWGVNSLRLFYVVSWWQENSTYRDFIKSIAEYLDSKDMYLIMCGATVNATDSQCSEPYPPYNENGAAYIASEDEWFSHAVNVIQTLGDYGNLIFELWNEPHSDKANWCNASNYCSSAIRSISDVPIIYQWNYGAYDGDPMTWVNTHGIIGTISNVIYSTHQYGNHIHSQTDYTTEAVEATLITSAVYNVTQEWNKPLFIGEWGPNLYYLGSEPEYTNELTAFDNLLYWCNQWNISQALWVWRSVGAANYYGLEYNQVFVPEPSDAGHILINGIHSEPFVWTVGNGTLGADYYIYSNNTAWTSSFSDNQLTIGYEPDCEVRVWWGNTTAYPVNATLQCFNSNGTLVNATDYYDSNTFLIELLSVDGTAWLIGYDVEATYYYLTVESPTGGTTDPTTGEYGYLADSYAIIEAFPEAGYSFSNWMVDGGNGGTDNPTSILMSENRTILANFEFYTGWGGGGGVNWGGSWGYFWIAGIIAGALAVFFKKYNIKNKYLQLGFIVIIEDMLLRILPIWILTQFMKLIFVYPISVSLDVSLHSISNKEDIKKRVIYAIIYNLAWYVIFYGFAYFHPILGFIAGILFHYILDIMMLKLRKQT